MGGFIVKLEDDKYIAWSPVVDAPICYAVRKGEAIELWGLERIERADLYGTSISNRQVSAEEAIVGNRAGPLETELTFDELIKACSP